MQELTRYAQGCEPVLYLAHHILSEACAQKPLILAVDGRCGSGKSSLAAFLSGELHCPVFHLDDFFLPPELRTPQRLSVPGENVHHERFLAEVITPFLSGRDVVFRPFSCRTGTFDPAVQIPAVPFAIAEGSYALHPCLRPYYAASVFVTCSSEQQRSRLLHRVGPQRFSAFESRWIPLEEQYFAAHHPQDIADLVFDTSFLCAPQPLY